MNKKKVPIVAIVGRANVGKSSLFNALLGRREAIVADEPGTTRDSVTLKAELESGKQFWLVDTAGMKAAEDEFELTIQEQILEAAEAADVILITVDGSTIITAEDRRVVKLAFKSGKQLALLVNKADKAKQEQIDAFEKLGIKPMIATSATQRIGFDDLEEVLEELLPAALITEDGDRIRLALLGRPNVGKSSLYNALAKKQQAIVADRAGTTRDVNHTIVKFQGREIELLDTAGIRRSGKIERGIEKFSVIRSLAAIEQSDVCMLLLDANELSVALDQKIAGLIKEAGKGLIIVVSKWDTVDKDAYTRDDLARGIAHEFNFVPWAPLVFTSSVDGKNVTKLFEITLEIMERRAQRISTRKLNNWLKKVLAAHPPSGLKNRQPKLRYMVQEDWNPIPSFKIFGAQAKYLHWSYKRHMDRMMREEWDYVGSPIQLWFIDRDVEKIRDIKLGGKRPGSKGAKAAKKFKNNGNRDKASK